MIYLKLEIRDINSRPAIYENGKMVEGVTECLISIRPDRKPLVFCHKHKQKENEPFKGHYYLEPDGFKVASNWVVYAPEELIIG